MPVADIEETVRFYVDVLGCSVGRKTDHWVDFNFFGHQVSAHLKPEATGEAPANTVDGEQVPVRHFGVVLDWQEWQVLSGNLQDEGMEFLIWPAVRFHGQAGEQATFFIRDPSGNALEFKSFRDPGQLFATG
ncbi:MAG: VOC family protein [Gammaproteobacteria bacterium]|nr:VOC family protein [Gammaproteobacteria bacterium]